MNKKKKVKLKKKNVGRLLIAIGIILLIVASVFITLYVLKEINGDEKYLKIELNGDSEVTIKYTDTYEDLGAKASYKDEDLTANIEKSNDYAAGRVGTYLFTYKIKYKKQEKDIKRTVKVIDDEKPTIKLKGREDLSLVVGTEYRELGASASDTYDGDLTDKIEVDKSNFDINTVGTYKVKYIIKDSSGNENFVERDVKVVPKPPENQKIPVLNYHFFYEDKSEKCNQSICLKMDKFREQLQYLKDNDFYTLTIQEFVSWMYGEIELPEKSVLLTVDDGNFGTSTINGNHLIPALEQYKIHATLFLITGWWPIGYYQSPYLDIQSHTHELHYEGIKGCAYRSKVNCISYDELVKDLKNSLEVVQDSSSFCFPYYEYTNTSLKAVKDVGFKASFIGGFRKASRSDDKYKIPRLVIYDSTSLATFKSYVN